MTMDETIKRINELYHKSQAEGLTDGEKEEQKELRQKYIDSIKGNLRGQLEHLSIQRPDGTIEMVKKKKLNYYTQRITRRRLRPCKTE